MQEQAERGCHWAGRTATAALITMRLASLLAVTSFPVFSKIFGPLVPGWAQLAEGIVLSLVMLGAHTWGDYICCLRAPG